MNNLKFNTSASFVLCLLAGLLAIVFFQEENKFFFTWEIIICLSLLSYTLYEKVK